MSGCDARRLRAVAVTAGAAAVGAACRSLCAARTPSIRGRKRGSAPRSVAELSKIRVGGSDQWVLERSENVENPVLLFVHGGPGTSQLTSNRRNTRGLERDFVVVNWDQRGAGKSYPAIGDRAGMTLEQIVEDARQVVAYLLDKYHQDKLVLVGHSWGSVVGALTVARYPELFHCYVGIGQVTDMVAGERATYAVTLEQARLRRNSGAVRKLEAMGCPPYAGDWQGRTMTQRGYLARFGGEVYGSPLGALLIVLGGVVVSPEYTLADRLNVFRGIRDSMRLLWPQLLDVDLFRMIPKMTVLVFLVEGRHDHEVPSALAAKWFDGLAAPTKELIWFEHSAHLPNFEERQRFDDFMIDRVRPLATPSSIPLSDEVVDDPRQMVAG